MNVLDDVLEIHVRPRLARTGRNRKEIVRRLRFGVSVTQNASILHEHFHFLRTQLQPEQSCQVLRTRDHLFLHEVIEERAEIIVQAAEIGLFFRADYRLPVGVLGRKHHSQF
jgi:hypothetical protein